MKLRNIQCRGMQSRICLTKMKITTQVQSYEFPLLCFRSIGHPPHLAMRSRKGGTCNHHPHRTCFGTPPSEVEHGRRHSVSVTSNTPTVGKAKIIKPTIRMITLVYLSHQGEKFILICGNKEWRLRMNHEPDEIIQKTLPKL